MLIDNFKIEDWFNRYEKSAIYDLADTCVDSLSINELLSLTDSKDKILSDLFSKKMNYGDIFGSDKLRNLISQLYKRQQINNITITHGAIGANQLVMQSLIEPNDKVVSILPTYQQHYSIPKSIGADTKILFLKEKNDWIPDLNELENIVGTNTKIICLNNPNNPTGAIIPNEILYDIVKIAQKSNAYILCDEVYRGLEHNNEQFCLSIADIYPKGISTSSMSKVFSLAGLRLGWVCANADIISKINLHREYNTISVGILDDNLAAIALEYKSKIVKRNIEKILEGKRILIDWLNKQSYFHCVIPNAGTTAFIRYDYKISSTDLCKKLQQDTGVMILPGETLEMNGYLRIGFGNNSKNLETGLNLFSIWCDSQDLFRNI